MKPSREKELDCLFDMLDRALDRLLEADNTPPRDVSEEELRIPCSPSDADAKGLHKHLCDCGTCWQHGDDLQSENVTTPAQFKRAHTCPSCGSHVTYKHGY